MRDLRGRVAVVTGAGSGIGRALAGQLAQQGMRVALADVDRVALDAAVDELRRGEFDVLGVPTDVSSADAVRALAEQTLAAFGAVHLVCNNAGVEGYMDGPIWEATPKDWQWTLGVNFWGVVNGVNVFLPLMLEQGEGHLAITASATGYTFPHSMYNLSKHAVVAYAEVVYAHLQQGRAPIGITLLCPGSVATNIFRHERPSELRNTPDAGRDLAAVELRRAMAARNRRRGRPPAHPAAALIEGIRTGRFYVFNDTDWDDLIRARNDHVLQRTNPDISVSTPQ